MILMLTTNWSGLDEQRVIKPRVIPKVIHARLVDASELKPKKVAKTVAKPKPKPRAKPKPKPVQKAKPKPEAKPKKTPPKVVEKVEPKPEPRLTAAELAAIARSELSQAMAEEEQAQAAMTSDDIAASYAALIQQTVVSYWSRPPSARNGMEVLLALQLIPTGEVVSVTVVKSSGNSAFDRSAMNAVQKAEQFPELKNLPSREFEKTFRRFRLLFRPEDLRY
ncbi:MAG: cell envelope integrity protein TolA [Proteobacteria bacterium]|nr:cell envelope integrity protein TolA [Pseudomonadota bacterium]